MPEQCVASESNVTLVDTLLPKAKIASYKGKSDLLASMESKEHLLIKKDSAVYASAKEPVATAESTTILSGAVIAEITMEEVQPQVQPTVVPVASVSLNAEVLFNMVNQHRINIGIPALQRDDSLTQVATERGPELFDEIFVNGNMHAGFFARHLPYRATENIIYFHSEEGAFKWWLNSPVHRASIENPTYTHTGIACHGRACSQIFAEFTSK